jgi:23S rRNA pseudouridine1911/1915/1917 synthase
MILYADAAGERLDAFLARAVEGLTRSGAQRLLEEGCVTVDGKPAKKNHKLNIGQVVSVTVPEP